MSMERREKMATIRETVYEAIANAMKVDVNTLTDDTI